MCVFDGMTEGPLRVWCLQDVLTAAKHTHLTGVLLPSAIARLSAALRVMPVPGTLDVAANDVCGVRGGVKYGTMSLAGASGVSPSACEWAPRDVQTRTFILS